MESTTQAVKLIAQRQLIMQMHGAKSGGGGGGTGTSRQYVDIVNIQHQEQLARQRREEQADLSQCEVTAPKESQAQGRQPLVPLVKNPS